MRAFGVGFAGVLLFHCSATPAPSPTPDASVAPEYSSGRRYPDAALA